MYLCTLYFENHLNQYGRTEKNKENIEVDGWQNKTQPGVSPCRYNVITRSCYIQFSLFNFSVKAQSCFLCVYV